jgi:hypothetical protein
MIHPHTELRHVNDEMGHGVFATRAIPRGTLVYVKDRLEIELTSRQFERLDPVYREVVNKYAYIDAAGRRVVSWDHGKYVNHRCECNTISTGYGFEIAIRDIAAGEEITDEYGLFNIDGPMQVNCGCNHCRKVVGPDDIDRYADDWDALVVAALACAGQVEQPLWSLLDKQTLSALRGYLAGKRPYRSVRTLRCSADEVLVKTA